MFANDDDGRNEDEDSSLSSGEKFLFQSPRKRSFFPVREMNWRPRREVSGPNLGQLLR
jgi:hypothetical protein